MKADRLFLLYNQPESARVRAILDMDAVIDNEFDGKDGQKLLVLTALDEDAAKDLLEHYGFAEEKIPLLVVHDGEIHRSLKQIMLHLRDQGMAQED